MMRSLLLLKKGMTEMDIIKNKEKNAFLLVKQLSEENERLSGIVEELTNEVNQLRRQAGEKWIHTKVYLDSIEQAKEAKKKYEEERKELFLLKNEYKKKIQELIDSY